MGLTPAFFSIYKREEQMGSPRERAERAASEAHGDPIQKLDPRKHGGLTGRVEYVGSVRERLEQDAYKQEPKSPRDARSAAVDYYYELYLAEQKKKTDEEAAERRKEQEQIAQRKRDEQQREGERVEKGKMFLVDLMFTSAA